MKTLSSAFILLSITFLGVHSSYIDNGKTGYIIGGKNAKFENFPYIASLRDRNMNHFCAGSIISDRWVLTAAHCILPGFLKSIAINTNQLDSPGSLYEISNAIRHYFYNMENGRNDIGLIKTAKNIIFNDHVKAIELPYRHIDCDESLMIAGWGVTNITVMNASKSLQWATVTTISNTKCSDLLTIELFNTNVCTLTDEAGACFGDSGGPLASSEIHGIISTGSGTCDTQFPSIFTRVYSYRIWIRVIKMLYFWS